MKSVQHQYLKDTPGFFVDESRNTFHSTTTSQSADSGLRDSLDVVSQNLSMTLSASLSQTFSSFSSSSHLDTCSYSLVKLNTNEKLLRSRLFMIPIFGPAWNHPDAPMRLSKTRQPIKFDFPEPIIIRESELSIKLDNCTKRSAKFKLH